MEQTTERLWIQVDKFEVKNSHKVTKITENY